ncbi:MAG: hypothetical protein JNL70_10640 [Saprospiraceae bacterium]|nr:hypothetical protein [Saprospiraceae bacterium]
MFKLFLPLYFVTTLFFSSIVPPSVFEERTTPVFNNCDNITAEVDGGQMFIKNIQAAHAIIDVYKIRAGGGWVKAFGCNDNCGGEVTLKVEDKNNYKVHVKLFDNNWQMMCEREINTVAVKAAVVKGDCENVVINTSNNVMTIGNLDSPIKHVDVYKVGQGGGWTNVFSCKEKCGKSLNVNVEANQKYIVHVKMFSRDWKMICEKQIEHLTPPQ